MIETKRDIQGDGASPGVSEGPPGPPTIERAPRLVAEGETYGSITDRIGGIPIHRPPVLWYLGLLLSAGLVLTLLTTISVLFLKGIGIWGVEIPVAWGAAIVNFVWWIGIGHAGTLISAILYLLHQSWRNSVNRLAEAMTLFAVACAAMFPILHLGRPWTFYWILPYPNQMGLWPQWRSPLVWDAFAVLTYGIISLVFWYTGLIPDLASMRDRARRRSTQRIYGLLALGWRGSALHWHRYKSVYLLLAGLATPLVVSVHSIVSLDFAVAIVPGWHSTFFPPYFVDGAIYSGFAMVLTLIIPLRKLYGLEAYITRRHLDYMAKLLLVTGLIVVYCYVIEWFFAWYGNDLYEKRVVTDWATGVYAPIYWLVVGCAVVVPQTMWFRWVRSRLLLVFFLAVLANVGMWFERFIIVITGLHRNHIASMWGVYQQTLGDYLVDFGMIGFFVFLLILFVRLFPSASMFEIKELIHRRFRRGEASESRAAVKPPSRPVGVGHAEPEHYLGSIYGLAAEFPTAEDLLHAARDVYAAGYRKMDAYTPFPVEGLSEALDLRDHRIPLIVLLGALAGGCGAFIMMSYSAVFDYPLNVGGRPLFSWPAFIPITFEMMVLFGGLAGLAGMLVLNRLPKLYHPIFSVDGFERASRDRFFLAVEAADPAFDVRETASFLERLAPLRVEIVRTWPEGGTS
ncbi:MAG TPA: quinol:electron acceptor oxidoreductase subunit ActD [Rhodothermales bacterium]|nr:quinol:electron acceptor oxidoreductase subunit ActD [Rhodothermales bacterium]